MMSVSEEWNWVKCSENRKTCEDFTSRRVLWTTSFRRFDWSCWPSNHSNRFPVRNEDSKKCPRPKDSKDSNISVYVFKSLFRSSVLILFWHSKVHKDAADFPFPLLPHRSAIVVSSDCNINIGLNMLQMQCWNNKRSNTKLETKPTTKGPKQTLNKSRRQHAGG